MSTGFQFNKGPLSDGGSPSSLSLPTHEFGIYNAETTQRFMLGTRYITWDGRVFKYSLANGTVETDRGVEQLQGQHMGYSSIPTTVAIGDTIVDVTCSGTDGDGSGNIAEDELAGGYIMMYDVSAGWEVFLRGIVGNDAVASGGTIRIYVDAPLQTEMVGATDAAEVCCSPYWKLTAGISAHACIPCVPAVKATSGQYFWGQTWGVCWCAPQSNLGANTESGHYMQAVFRSDGSVDLHDKSSQGGDSYTNYQQHAGFILTYAIDNTQSARMFMLQISI